jgi:hypothetical protein
MLALSWLRDLVTVHNLPFLVIHCLQVWALNYLVSMVSSWPREGLMAVAQSALMAWQQAAQLCKDQHNIMGRKQPAQPSTQLMVTQLVSPVSAPYHHDTCCWASLITTWNGNTNWCVAAAVQPSYTPDTLRCFSSKAELSTCCERALMLLFSSHSAGHGA